LRGKSEMIFQRFLRPLGLVFSPRTKPRPGIITPLDAFQAHRASRPAATSRFVAAQPNDDPAVAPSDVDRRLCNPKQGKATADRDASPPRVGLGSRPASFPSTHAASPPPILPPRFLPLPRPLLGCRGALGVPFHPTPIRTPAPPARRFLRLPVRNPILLLLVARTDSLLLLPPLAAYYKRVSVAANAGNQFECVLLRSRGFLRFAGTPLSVRPCCPSSSTAAVGGCCFSAREIGSVDPVG